MRHRKNGVRDELATLAELRAPRVRRRPASNTLVITCSESTAAASIVAALDPACVLQNLGNEVPPGPGVDLAGAATIEHALGPLGVRHVVLCGHSPCSAHAPGFCGPSLEIGAPRAQRVSPERDRVGTPDPKRVSQARLLVQLARLRSHPAALAPIARGAVRVCTLWLDEDAQRVHAFSARAQRFVELSPLDLAHLLAELTGDTSLLHWNSSEIPAA